MSDLLKNLGDKWIIKKEIKRIENALLELYRQEKAERDKFSMKILEIQATRETYEQQQRWLKGMI